MSIWLIMRNEIDLAADQAKREIHDMTVQACKDLGCYEYYRIPSTFTAEQQKLIVDTFSRQFKYRCYWNHD